jgi:hypothetical protein
VWVFWLNGETWCMGDLHQKNLMRTQAGDPTIIDALIAPIPVGILEGHHHLQHAARRAEALRKGLPVEPDDVFHGVSDDEL